MKRLNLLSRARRGSRVSPSSTGTTKTDQSAKKACDINAIVDQYARTGMLPEPRKHLARYLDTTQLPSFEEAFSIVSKAKQSFALLPAELRRTLGNDPANLEHWLKDPANAALGVRYGLLEAPEASAGTTTSPKAEKPSEGDSKASKEAKKSTEAKAED